MKQQSCLFHAETGRAKEIENYAVLMVPFQIQGSNVLVASMSYRNEGDIHSTVRVPCGTQKKTEPGTQPESLTAAVKRELYAEFANVERPEELQYELQRGVLNVRLVPDDSDRENLLHAKVTIGVKYLGGSIREKELVDDHKGREEHLGVPVWSDAVEVYEKMKKSKSPRAHPEAVLNLLHRLAEQDAGIAAQYSTFLDRNPKVELDSNEFKHVSAYLTSL